jgi:outer membrane autotransporter protein
MIRLAAGLLTFLVAASALAECGGSVQCIGVGPDPTFAATAGQGHHPAPDLGTATFTLAFAGTQQTGTSSASQTIHVAAVTGPAGSMAVLGPITITGAGAAHFTITGGTCSPTNGPIHDGAVLCTINVAFTPLSAGAQTALLNIPLDPPPGPGLISGRSVALSGTGFGATVAAPRTDPSRDPTVVAAIRAQQQTGMRLSRAQVSNYTQRLEQLRGNAPELSGASGASVGGLEVSTGIWLGGSLNFGRSTDEDMASLRFRTKGMTLGADTRLGQRFTVGVGIGLARDDTDIGTDGSEVKTTGRSFALYGSYRPTANTFVDALVGAGKVEHETDRFVTAAQAFARSDRDGRQTFGAMALGYEYRRQGLLLSPYLRYAYSRERLDETTETVDGSIAPLTYFEQTISSSQASIGLRAQSRHETSFGWAQPKARIEWVRDSISDRPATIAFADQLGTTFEVSTLDTTRTSVVFGVGTDFVFRRGLTLGVDYLHQRLPGPDSNQAIRLWLSQDLDGRAPGGGVSAGTFENPLTVEAAYLWDDNLNRAPDSGPKLGDHVFSLNAGSAFVFPLTGHTRFLLTPFVESDKLYRYDGLDRVSLGAQGDVQYRTSGAFTAPTFALFGRFAWDDYHSELRSGKRRSIGVSVRQSWTDRIDVFGAIARNVRDADSVVWDTKDTSVRLNLDYAIGPGILYLGAQYSGGDAVSSVGPGFEAAVATKATVRDDAYDQTLFAHRYTARAWVGTLGYNFPLGARDSLDLSYRHARAKPLDQLGGGGGGGYGGGGEVTYTANQYLVSYLTRF